MSSTESWFTPNDQIVASHAAVVDGYLSGKAESLESRKGQLRDLYYALKDNEQALKDALFEDFHRSKHETALFEFDQIYTEISTAVANLDKWASNESLGMGDLKIAAMRPVLRKTPYGAVLIISPWNFPYALSIVPTISALAAGNTVVLKLTEMAPKSSQLLAKVLTNALDPSILRVVLASVEGTTTLLDQKWDKIMLTGSCNVGRIVAKAAAKNLTPVVLELGGKSPVFVSKNANILLAAKRIAWGKFMNAGQICIAPDYVLVDEEVQPQFIEEVNKAVQTFFPNLNPDSDYTHIVTHKMWDRIANLVKTTKGKIELQDGTPERESKFYPPTVVSNVQLDDVLMTEELFAPIMPIITVKSVLVDGPGIVRKHDHPLALYIFTDDKNEADFLLTKTRSGSVIVNDVLLQAGSAAVPFGGVGPSGVGSYHGKAGFDEFTYDRPVLRQPGYVEPLMSLRYPPYSDDKSKKLHMVSRPRDWMPRKGPVKGGWLSWLF